MAPVPTPPANEPDLSEEEAARTPNGYPTYYDKIAEEESILREKIEGKAREAAALEVATDEDVNYDDEGQAAFDLTK